jgi:hypothetical protein
MLLKVSAMLSKALTCLIVGLALGAGAIRLPAAVCMVANAPSKMACTADCCADMACCETSADRTAPPAQPLANAGLHQSVSAMPAIDAVAVIIPFATESHVFSSAERRSQSPPTLALICIRLI